MPCGACNETPAVRVSEYHTRFAAAWDSSCHSYKKVVALPRPAAAAQPRARLAARNYETKTRSCEKLTADSVVLLKNENIALPLAKSDRNVNVFGWASYSMRYQGGGSGGGSSPDRLGDKFHFFLDALEEQGISYNKELTELYKSYKDSNAGSEQIVEMPVSNYSEDVIKNAKEFSDTAVVVLSRGSGENIGTMTGEIDHTQDFKYSLPADKTRTALELSTEEEDLMNLVCENFGKVIVMVNTGNPMHLGILEDERIDSALYVGYPGQSGAVAIAKILTGEVLPSGKLSDTYIYEPESDPSFVNNKRNGDNIQYVEDIYFGYKWYETADAEGSVSTNMADRISLTVGGKKVVLEGTIPIPTEGNWWDNYIDIDIAEVTLEANSVTTFSIGLSDLLNPDSFSLKDVTV